MLIHLSKFQNKSKKKSSKNLSNTKSGWLYLTNEEKSTLSETVLRKLENWIIAGIGNGCLEFYKKKRNATNDTNLSLKMPRPRLDALKFFAYPLDLAPKWHLQHSKEQKQSIDLPSRCFLFQSTNLRFSSFSTSPQTQRKLSNCFPPKVKTFFRHHLSRMLI